MNTTPVYLECNHCITITTILYESDILKTKLPHFCPFCGQQPALGNVTIDPVPLPHFFSIHVLSPTDNTLHPTPFGASTLNKAQIQLDYLSKKYPNRTFSITPPTQPLTNPSIISISPGIP